MGIRKTNEEHMKELMLKVNKTDTCWNWIGRVSGYGYGETSYKGKTIGAHRKMWQLVNGDISSDESGLARHKVVCHKCNNKLCINPDHLYLGSHSDNSKDILLSGKHNSYDYSKGRYTKEIGFLRATVYFEYDNADEIELNEWLQTLPHGSFSEVTKQFWKTRMEIQKEENHPEKYLYEENARCSDAIRNTLVVRIK